jgi:ADP-ribosylglycohydrolase
MLGAIVGDIVGSVHEFVAIPTKSKDFGDLFVENKKEKLTLDSATLSDAGFIHKGSSDSHFTDDTVCTVAIARWLLDRSKSAEQHMRETCNQYPRRGYGGNFAKWVINPNSKPYNSWGNGSAMRVSPCGWAASSLEEAYALAEESAIFTHGHPEAIKGAKAVAGIIYLIRHGSTKEDAVEHILKDLDDNDGGYYRHITSLALDQIRPTYTFKVSCKDTVPQAIRCLLEGEDFEDVIRNAISLGGDADTLAAIAGSMAEPLFGIPEQIIKESVSRVDDGIRITIVNFVHRFMV